MQRIFTLIQNPIARNSFIMFFGTMAVNFGAYLYQVVVLRIMGPAQYSELAALFSILFIISVPAQVGQTVLTKFFSERKAHNDIGGAKSLFLKTIKYLLLTSIIGLFLYLPFVPILKQSLKIHELTSFIGLYGIFVTFFLMTVCISALNGFQKFFPSTVFTTLSMVLRLASGILFAASGVAMTVTMSAVANLISLIVFIIPMKFLLRVKTEPFTIHKKATIEYAIPTMLVLLGVTMMYNVDVVLVKMFFQAEAAGLYGGLTIFGKIIFFAATAILLAIFPMVAERRAIQKPYSHLVWGGLLGISLMSGVIVAGYFLLAPFVTHLLFGPKFSGVVPYLGIFGLFMMAVTIINYIATISLAVHKTGIWKIIAAGSLFQIAAITLFHQSLTQVIWVNILVTFIIMIASLLYYSHETKHS